MVLGLLAALAAAALFGVIAVVQAVVVRRTGMLSWPMAGVLVAYLVGWLLHLVAIARLPLYLAQVGIAGSLIITVLVAAIVIGEPLTVPQWLAVAGLAGGLAVLALAAGPVGHPRFTLSTTALLYGVLVLNATAGLLLWRRRGPGDGAALGALAGLAYAGSPVATRALVDPERTLASVAAILSIGLFGALGFALYSGAMRRTSVTAATAPLITLQTVLPSVVGLAAFGDGVRAGWWPAAILAFGVSVAAAAVLAGAEARLEALQDATGPAWRSPAGTPLGHAGAPPDGPGAG